MRWRIAPVLLLAGLAGAQQAPTRSPLPRGEYKITGQVINSVGGQPLPSLDVSITSAQQRDQVQHTVSDDRGHFAFLNVAPGKYALEARGHGFVNQAFKQHEGFSTAIAVGPGLVSEGLVFPVNPDASISGNLTDEQDEAVREGQVLLFVNGLENGKQGIQLAAQATPDDTGHYRFSHLAPGKYYIAVLAQPWYAQHQPGITSVSADESGQAEAPRSDLDVAYPTTYYAGATDESAATVITLKAGDRFTADVQLRATPALHLLINSSAQKSPPSAGLPQVTVTPNLQQRLFGSYETYVAGATTSYSSGGMTHLELTGVPPGHYVVSFPSSDGKEAREQEMDIASDMELDPAGVSNASVTITGTVHIEGSTTFPQVRYIRFENHENGDVFGTNVDQHGEFELQHPVAKPGLYEISSFNMGGYYVSSVTATGGKVSGHTLQLAPGSSVKLSIGMSKGLGTVDGTVLRDNKPVAEAMVVLVPQEPGRNLARVRRDQSDSDGTFTLASIVPGKYTVVAIQNGWDLEWSNPEVLKPFLANGEPVEVRPEGKYQIKAKAQGK